VWQKRAGEFHNIEGYGASPLLYEGRLIVLADNLKAGFLIALDPHTGIEIWKTARGNAASYASPLADAPGGRRQVIAHGGGSSAG